MGTLQECSKALLGLFVPKNLEMDASVLNMNASTSSLLKMRGDWEILLVKLKLKENQMKNKQFSGEIKSLIDILACN
jgi:hypothetical protein